MTNQSLLIKFFRINPTIDQYKDIRDKKLAIKQINTNSCRGLFFLHCIGVNVSLERLLICTVNVGDSEVYQKISNLYTGDWTNIVCNVNNIDVKDLIDLKNRISFDVKLTQLLQHRLYTIGRFNDVQLLFQQNEGNITEESRMEIYA